MSNFVDLTGKQFGRLTVVNRVENKKSKPAWFCRCDCGKEKVIISCALKRGITLSCGCYRDERVKSTNTKHGLKKTRLYNIWINMKQRCYNNRNPKYPIYGKRGISICSQWLKNFITFYNWAILNGYKDTLTIDRINVNGNYEPNNCRWITNQEQQRNKRNSSGWI